MTVCSCDKSHVYPNTQKKCPWCEAEKRREAANNFTVGKVPPIITSPSVSRTHTGTGSTSHTTTTLRPAYASGASAASAVTARRSEGLLWLVCIACGLLTGPVFAEPAVSIINGELNLNLPYEACLIAMMILGCITGCFISFLARDAYVTAYNGWPWLLLGLTVPPASLLISAILVIAIALVLGIISAAIGIIGLIIFLAFCSGG